MTQNCDHHRTHSALLVLIMTVLLSRRKEQLEVVSMVTPKYGL